MTTAVAVILVVGLAGLLGLMLLTGLGARRRGRGALPAVLAGVFFPVTWVAWYVVDDERSLARRRTTT